MFCEKNVRLTRSWLAAVAGTVMLALVLPAWPGEQTVPRQQIEAGKELATGRSSGNCLACHAMGDGALPGNLGPPLMSMKLRYPDKQDLRDQVWDATKRNPDTLMPPFGKHGILSREEINLIVEYLYTL